MSTGYLIAKNVTAPATMNRAIASSTVQIGTASPGTALTFILGAPAQAFRMNGAIIWACFDAIRRSTDDGQTWTVVHVYGAVMTNNSRDLWAGICYSNGVPLGVVLATIQATGNVMISTSSDGITWAWTNMGAVASGFAGLANHNGVIYVPGTSSFVNVTAVNPFALTIGTVPAMNNFSSRYLVPWNGGLYGIALSVGSIVTLWSLDSAFLVQNVVTPVGGLSTRGEIAFVDQATGDLIVLVKAASSSFITMYRVGPPPSYTVTPITAPITGTSTPTATTAYFPGVIYDQDANPGGPPVIYILMATAASSGTPVTAWRWNGVSAMLGTSIGNANSAGGAVDLAWPDKVGGEKNFTQRFTGADGSPEILGTGKGPLGTALTRRKFRLIKPRSQILTTIGGSPATYNLAGAPTPLAATPLQPGRTVIKGVINGVTHVATDLVTPGVLSGPVTATVQALTLPQPQINVTSTGLSTGGPRPSFPSSGRLLITTSLGPEIVNYTSISSATQFAGCTGGTGLMSIGGLVRGALVPLGGTVDYLTGAMTGVTDTLDAGSTVEALYNGGTAAHEWYRADAVQEYPGSTARAPLTSPTSGTIGTGLDADRNITCLADGSEQQISVGMSGFSPGDAIGIVPRAT